MQVAEARKAQQEATARVEATQRQAAAERARLQVPLDLHTWLKLITNNLYMTDVLLVGDGSPELSSLQTCANIFMIH